MLFALGEDQVELVGEGQFVAPGAVLIGKVILQAQASVWFNAVLRGDNEPIVIGERSNVQDGSVLHTDPGHPLTLGRGVTVGHLAMLHGCEVGDNTLIGINAVILNGAKIGCNCIIGANTLVGEGKVIPDNSMVLGSPGKVVRSLDEAAVTRMQRTANVYVEKSLRYNNQLRSQT
ncbi:MAG: gamma carbonic anhydrase family protein [Chromatiaceae bacterium]|nr:gamma carbonic anhydrase family protein [Gammaproteobacteria bacterium]MCB1863061.1 gamma carbonic anhydrase family protein [Gammaproteobacteria bacterium]MCB1880048.1 gamma carbonic anhydrase family protein [Gammaproteobacteria bacterium]MCP5445568.1 gamma carbonic anhydrase family protein [Chromatiaceae bacterium]